MRQIEKDKVRSKELNLFIKRLYEDNVTGKISDERCEMLIAEYKEEQKTLTARLAGLEREAEQAAQVDVGIDKFTEIVNRNLGFDELTPAILREFVDKIVVHEPVKIDGKRHQNVDIYYCLVGRLDLPAEYPGVERPLQMRSDGHRIPAETQNN